MKNLRRWSPDDKLPPSLTIAADARLSRTDYADDQSWDVRLGQGDAAAIALQGQAGGRAGLISVVPMWKHDHHIIYQSQTYAQAPQFISFAPNYVEAQALIVPELELMTNFWVMESHAVGGMVRLKNNSDHPITIQMSMFGHVGINSREQLPEVVQINKRDLGLSFGRIGNLEPVLMLHQGQAIYGVGSGAKLGFELSINPGKSVMRRWVYVGLNDLKRSIRLAQDWLELDWQPFMQQISEANLALPKIKTDDDALDMVLALSTQRLAQAFLRPAGELPGNIFVGARVPTLGYSPRLDGRDHPRSWAIQDATLAYQIGRAVATIHPAFAKDMIRNALAKQEADGAIDLRTSPSSLREGVLATPVLARLAWQIYELEQDQAFLKASLPGLLRFFDRWMAVDADGDGVPEWQDERQLGYVALTSFGIGQSWAQGGDIRFVETPSLLAFLISEAESLLKMAGVLGDSRTKDRMKSVIRALHLALEEMWTGERYQYRDRDHHGTQGSISVLSKAPGDVPHNIRVSLDAPSRFIIRVVGGANHQPKLKLRLTGQDQQGNALVEVLETTDFVWLYRQGIATTRKVFAQLDEVSCEGLSRVYQINVDSYGTTALDLTTLLPLWLQTLPSSRQKALVALLTDPNRFQRSSGLSIADAQGPRFDPSSAEGEGGVWPFWQMLMIESLLQVGENRVALEIMRQYLDVLVQIWKKDGRYGQFYHSDKAESLGEKLHLAGIAPFSLLQQMFGVAIVSATAVWTGGSFAWGKAVVVEQHGVMVRRTRNGARIRFASGNVVEVDNGSPWQLLEDKPSKKKPSVAKAERPTPPSIPPVSGDEPAAPAPRVKIEVDHEE